MNKHHGLTELEKLQIEKRFREFIEDFIKTKEKDYVKKTEYEKNNLIIVFFILLTLGLNGGVELLIKLLKLWG